MNKENSIIMALDKPKTFLNNRQDAIKEAAASAGDALEQYQNKLLKVGVPSETARNMALQYAKAIYDTQINAYNIANPGYEQVIGQFDIMNRANHELADVYYDKKADRKAQKKAIIKKYKAKKARKAATKTTSS